MSVGCRGVNAGLRRHLPARRAALETSVGNQIGSRCETGIIKPEGARGRVIRVEDDVDHVGGRLVSGGHADPAAGAGKGQVEVREYGPADIMALHHPYATGVAGPAKGAEAVRLTGGVPDPLTC